MAKDIIAQAEPHIREIVRICRALEAEGRELDELNDLVGRTIQNYSPELNGGTSSPCPINIEFKRLRRSGRQTSQKKRGYKNTQGTSKSASRLAKKPKLATDEPANDDPAPNKTATDKTATATDETDEAATDKLAAHEPATKGPANEPPTLESTDELAIAEPNIIEPRETSRGCTSIQGNTEAMALSAVVPLMERLETAVSGVAEGDLPAITHADGVTILDEYFLKSAISSPLQPMVQSCAPEALTILLRTSAAHAGSSEPTGILEPDQGIGSCEMSKSTSNTGSVESLSSCIDQTSNISSETDVMDIESPDAVPNTPFARRSILDDSGQWLGDVLEALEHVQDDFRTPNSSVPGVLDDIPVADFTNFVSIMTSITENWAKCNRRLARPALEAAEERLREFEQNISHGIRTNRHQMNMIGERRAKFERLQRAVACRNVRELSSIALQDLSSKPAELTCEFREQSDYESAIKQIEKENADDTRNQLRRLWKETYYWPMIQEGAKVQGSLPKPSGPESESPPKPSGRKSEITLGEKWAAKKLIVLMRYGQSRNNIFKWTSYWRLLSNLRDRGTTAFLLCRTSEFKAYVFHHPKTLEMLLSWHKVYDFPLRQLQLRVIAEEDDDFSGKSDIEELWIRKRLHAPENMRWGDHLSVWDKDSTDHKNFFTNHSPKPTSGKSNIDVLRHGIKGQLDRNKSVYISLVPYEGESDKKTFSNKAASSDLLAVAPLVVIAPGDFLGIFPGRLRYTDQKPTKAIRGPLSNLWLDYSEVMGKLNRIKVAKTGQMTNVCLGWEGVNEIKGHKLFCQYFRVLVIATRHILPFDQLVRPCSKAPVLSELGGTGTLESRGRE